MRDSSDADGGRRRHKDLQLCRQVFDALTYALAELDDPVIGELVLAAVDPAPSASRVQVTLTTLDDQLDGADALARLSALAPTLRAEIAAEVTRRRVPELVFAIRHPSQL
jgi:ribosome-binding factor A